MKLRVQRLMGVVGIAMMVAGAMNSGCSSENAGGMLLRPGGTMDVAIKGDTPSLEIGNDGKGSVVAVLTQEGRAAERIEIGPGQTVIRSVPGGGRARVENGSTQDAYVRVKGRGGSGFHLSGKNPASGK